MRPDNEHPYPVEDFLLKSLVRFTPLKRDSENLRGKRFSCFVALDRHIQTTESLFQ